MFKFFNSLNIVSSFIKDRNGIAATEFAFVVPIMFLLFFGAIEGTVIHSAGDRVARAANILSDVPTKASQISLDEVDDLFIGIENVIQPIDTLLLDMNLVSIIPNDDGNPVVHWSRSNDETNKTPYQPGDPYTDLGEDTVLLDGFSIVVAEVAYVHESGLTGRLVDSAINYELQKARVPRTARRVQLCQSRDDDGVYQDCIL